MVKSKVEMPLRLRGIAIKLFSKRRDSHATRQIEHPGFGQHKANLNPRPHEASTLSPLPDLPAKQCDFEGAVDQRTVRFPDASRYGPHSLETSGQEEEPAHLFRLQRPFRPNLPTDLFIETSSGPVPFLSFGDCPPSPTPSTSTDEGDYGPERLFEERMSSPTRPTSTETYRDHPHHDRINETTACYEDRNQVSGSDSVIPNIPNTLGTFYCLQIRTTGLLQSFCILDAALPGKPICVASKDMMPSESFADNEALFIEDDLGDENLRVESSDDHGITAHHLLLKHDLVPLGSSNTSHQVISQIDITNLALQLTDEDVWLQLATEEMKRLATWNRILLSHLPVLPSPFEDLPTDVQQNINCIQAFNSFSFIISQSLRGSDAYELTHISRHWLSSPDDSITSVVQGFSEGLPRLAKHLAKGQRFFFDIRVDLAAKQELVCCVPMFGPRLSCWLCFLISGPIFESCLSMGSFK